MPGADVRTRDIGLHIA